MAWGVTVSWACGGVSNHDAWPPRVLICAPGTNDPIKRGISLIAYVRGGTRGVAVRSRPNYLSEMPEKPTLGNNLPRGVKWLR